MILTTMLALSAMTAARAAGPEELRAQAGFALEQSYQAAFGNMRYEAQSLADMQRWWREHTLGAPYTGRHRPIFVPAEQANKLGALVYGSMLAKYRKDGLIDNDPVAVAQLKRVCDRLIAVADQPALEWEYHLISTGAVNAFAVAGGKIGVLQGILKYTEDDYGLAVVLSHEVAHVVQRHLDERLSEIILIQLANVAGDIAAPHFLPVLIPKHLANIANMTATVHQIYNLFSYEGTRLAMAGFGRTQEAEADYVGLILMAKAGYDPLLAPAFWKRMLKGMPDPKFAQLVKWWRDHPLTSERIASVERWAPEARDGYYKP